MAVQYSRLLAPGSDGEMPGLYVGDRKRSWYVKVSSVADTSDTVYASGHIPYIGSALSGAPQCTLRSYTPERIGKFSFKMTGNYSSRPETPKEREERERALILVPWLRSPEITGEVVEGNEEPVKDVTGKEILNSYKRHFGSNKSRPTFAPVIRVTARFRNIPSWYYQYGVGVLNNSATTVRLETGALPAFPAGTLLYAPASFPRVKSEGENWIFIYHEISFELRYKPLNEDGKSAWDSHPIDNGYEWDEGGKEAQSTSGSTVLLNGLGGKLTDGAPPVRLEFKYHNRKDFGVLPLNAFFQR